jgi:hypothetical protein
MTDSQGQHETNLNSFFNNMYIGKKVLKWQAQANIININPIMGYMSVLDVLLHSVSQSTTTSKKNIPK